MQLKFSFSCELLQVSFWEGGGLTSLSLSLALAANTGVLEEVKLVSAFLSLNMGNRGLGFTFK